MVAASLLAAPVALPSQRLRQHSNIRRGRSMVVRVDNRPLREFNENDGKLSTSGEAAAEKEAPGALYADENPPPPRDTMSPEMKERLRREYYGLGGSPNKAMGSNYFLYIILGISLLAVLSKLTGAI